MSAAVVPVVGEQVMVALETTKEEDHDTKTPRKKRSKSLKRRVFKFMDSTQMQLLLGALLIVSLFLPDAWILGNVPSDRDEELFSVLMAIFVIFVFETVILSLVQDDYFLSFFFWMDFIGTLSIILDIGWIADEFMPEDSSASRKGSLLRAARAAKLGARYGRLMRLMKLFRFFKFLPCFNSEDIPPEAEPTMSAVRKVSNELSSVLARRVAALVMLIVIVVPFLSYEVTDNSMAAWLENLKLVAKNESVTQYDLAYTTRKFRNFYDHKAQKPFKVHIESPYTETYHRSYDIPYDVRNDNILNYEGQYNVDGTKYKVKLSVDRTVIRMWDAFFGIMLIILVIVVLVGFSASFQNAVDVLVVVPLEKMMTTLRKSAKSMLKSMQAMDKDDESKERDKSAEDEDMELETAVLEKMVEKLARIVKHVTGDDNLQVDENVDKATANWLNENYATQAKKRMSMAVFKEVDAAGVEEKARQLRSQHSSVDPVLINSWNFDVTQYTHEELMEVTRYLLDVFNVFSTFEVPVGVYNTFVKVVSGKYIAENTYHNFFHACDVMHATYRIIVTSHFQNIFTTLEMYAMLIAALGHDIGHPGVNNAFLVKTRHPLAMMHNDRSPLENMHCCSLYEILKNQDCNIFATLEDSQWREVRKIMLSLILGTDMVHHFEQVSKAQVFVEVNGEDVKRFCTGQSDVVECMADEKNRLFLMELMLHSSDISNPFKPFVICAKWADLVAEEFFRQGDKERESGMDISPMMDRNNSNLFNMQMGFIEFVVSPLVIAMVQLLPSCHEIGSNMLNNFICWGDKRKAEITATGDAKAAEDCSKVDERVNKFKDKLAFVKALGGMKRRRSNASLHSST